MTRHSISRRLAAMFAAVALCVFTAVGGGLFLVLRVQLEHHSQDSLDDRAEIAGLIVYHASTPEKWKFVREKLTDLTPRDNTTLFAVASADPRFAYGQPLTGQVVKSWPGGYVRVRPTDSESDMLTRTLTVPANGARPPVQLQVAADCSPNVRTMRVFGWALAALSALGSLVVLLLSYWVATLGLAPLTRLIKDASEVSPNNRSQRLDTNSLPSELNDLANSFNSALERLDGAYGRLESFNADVAHELRTPVTILIGQTEVALTRNRSVDELRQTLQSNLEEFERMRMIINDMLFLARADQGERATGLVEVSLAAEAAHTLEFLEIPLEEGEASAVLRGDARTFVNKSLFGRALANLVMNAIQHAPRGAEIAVTITRDADQILIAVANPGALIEPARLCHLFDRFYRAEASRTNSRENHGLGLAIVKAVAEMHRGKVFVSSANGINTFGFSVAGAGLGQQNPEPISVNEIGTTAALEFAPRRALSP